MFTANANSLFCLEGIDLYSVQGNAGSAKINVSLPSDTTILRILPLKNKRRAVESGLSHFGFSELPAPGRFSTAGRYRLAWAGQNCWHLFCSPGAAILEPALKQALGGVAAVSRAGDGLLRLLVEGEEATALMAKACALDLDKFQRGHCAVTSMAHTRLYLHRVSSNGYELFIPVSHAASFWEWLIVSAAEFGMQIVDDQPTPL